jgi:anti-sigma B factor antagonist
MTDANRQAEQGRRDDPRLEGKITIGKGDVALRERCSRRSRGIRSSDPPREGGTIDSSGVGELVSAFTTVTNRGGKLKLVNLPPKVNDILQITQLITVFEVYDTKTRRSPFLTGRASDRLRRQRPIRAWRARPRIERRCLLLPEESAPRRRASRPALRGAGAGSGSGRCWRSRSPSFPLETTPRRRRLRGRFVHASAGARRSAAIDDAKLRGRPTVHRLRRGRRRPAALLCSIALRWWRRPPRLRPALRAPPR